MNNTTIEYCPPVGEVYGTPPDKEMLQATELKAGHDEIAANIEASYAQRALSLEDGTAARRAMDNLGCVACYQATTCQVRESLKQRMIVGEENARIVGMSREIEEAPRWLKTARE